LFSLSFVFVYFIFIYEKNFDTNKKVNFKTDFFGFADGHIFLDVLEHTRFEDLKSEVFFASDELQKAVAQHNRFLTLAKQIVK
jgi:hypothetical protein